MRDGLYRAAGRFRGFLNGFFRLTRGGSNRNHGHFHPVLGDRHFPKARLYLAGGFRDLSHARAHPFPPRVP